MLTVSLLKLPDLKKYYILLCLFWKNKSCCCFLNHHLQCIRLSVTLLSKIKWSSLGVYLTPVQILFLSYNRCLSHFDTSKEKRLLIPFCSAERGSKFYCDCSKLNCCECFLAGNYQILHVTSNECFYDYSIDNSDWFPLWSFSLTWVTCSHTYFDE